MKPGPGLSRHCRIRILGKGCPKCKKLAESTEAAAKELRLEYELEKVTDITAIMSFGVMMTPALAVNGEVKVTGRVPSVAELKKCWLE
ncbi:MAG: thioredoxin family protein [bacterium]